MNKHIFSVAIVATLMTALVGCLRLRLLLRLLRLAPGCYLSMPPPVAYHSTFL
jgi:hypothetical protein